jgi:hypothetical protein
MSGWIGVDFDGTLATYDGWRGPEHLGEPIAPMVQRVRTWLAEGQDVRIVTARMAVRPGEPDVNGNAYPAESIARQRALIEAWCQQHLGRVLPITASKDFQLIELWDDRCVQVIPNTGITVEELLNRATPASAPRAGTSPESASGSPSTGPDAAPPPHSPARCWSPLPPR